MNEVTNYNYGGVNVYKDSEGIYTTSREIARVFEKDHKNVTRDIENITKEMCSKLSVSKYYSKMEYLDVSNRVQQEYRCSEQGMQLLIMGFTGTKALQYKIAFIEAFDYVKEQLYIGQQQYNELLFEYNKLKE